MKGAAMFGVMMCLATLGSGCKQEKPADGPAEHAGEKIDIAAEKTKQAGKEAVDSTKESADDAKKSVEKKTDKK